MMKPICYAGTRYIISFENHCLLVNLYFFLKLLNDFACPQIEQHAVASAGDDKYHGTNATFNVWQPTLEGTMDFSLAQLWILGGSYAGNDLNSIEAGWQVRLQRESNST